ncbi:Catalase-peroxidase (Partial), partial [Seminavis robusta]
HARSFKQGNKGTSPADWWPEQLDVSILKKNENNNAEKESQRYAQQFAQLDLSAVERDLKELMTSSVDWWPADYGHYGPFFIRMAWHSAGTYRIWDGRGGGGSGQLRFAPLNSWPDNGNLDKARRLLWPLKQKYGARISWADLFILTGNVALESMGFPTMGFAGGRVDVEWPEDHVDWGSETKWLDANRDRYATGNSTKEHERNLAQPLGAVQMGLIYVNPEGPNGVPDPVASARDIRETFARMAMNDEETVALIAGGHTFGKAHGAGNPEQFVGPEPEGASIEQQGLGWKNTLGSGKGGDTITSGLEGAWTVDPIRWDNGYFDLLFGYEWELTKSPAGAQQWIPKNYNGAGVPDAHDASKQHLPIMLTSDLALRMDPKYATISKRFHANPKTFQEAFAKAWYKLTHRDMGPIARCLGPKVPPPQLWQDPVPPQTYPTIEAPRHQAWLKQQMLSRLTPTQLVSVAWASASTFRQTDKRGGANGARIRLAPQKDWECNNGLQPILAILESIQREFHQQFLPVQVSMADLIVLGGCAGIEAVSDVPVRFTPGRTDATQAMTDVQSFAVLEPRADGFRNFLAKDVAMEAAKPEEWLVETADRLALTAREMTVLVGGLRALGVGGGTSTSSGVLTHRVGQLTNDIFVNLLDDAIEWKPAKSGNNNNNSYQGVCRKTGRIVWPNASRVDLIFGSHSVLRGLAETYALAGSQGRFARDFSAAFAKVMELDRFDVVNKATSRL